MKKSREIFVFVKIVLGVGLRFVVAGVVLCNVVVCVFVRGVGVTVGTGYAVVYWLRVEMVSARNEEVHMSAYMVSDKHISAMLAAANPSYWAKNHGRFMHYHGQWKEYDSNQALGQILASQNRRSVNHRYAEGEPIPEFQFEGSIPAPEPVQLIKLCDCYEYQSCETDDWNKTEAHAISQALRECAIRSLPGYDEAAWDYDEIEGARDKSRVRPAKG